MSNKKCYKHRRIGGRKGKMKLDHHIVWEKHNGKIPEGHEIHHKDGDPKNNHIRNLMCLTRHDHLRMHSKYFFKIEGTWHSFCKWCKDIITDENRLGSKNNICKKCHADICYMRKKRRICAKS